MIKFREIGISHRWLTYRDAKKRRGPPSKRRSAGRAASSSRYPFGFARGVARLVGIEGGVVSGVINLESSGVDAPDWRPRHDEHYHEA